MMILFGVGMILIGLFVMGISFWRLGCLLMLIINMLVLVLCNGLDVLFKGVMLIIWVCSLVVIRMIIFVVFGFDCDSCRVVVVRVKFICFVFKKNKE